MRQELLDKYLRQLTEEERDIAEQAPKVKQLKAELDMRIKRRDVLKQAIAELEAQQ